MVLPIVVPLWGKIVLFSLAKKLTVVAAARIYGFPRLYRKSQHAVRCELLYRSEFERRTFCKIPMDPSHFYSLSAAQVSVEKPRYPGPLGRACAWCVEASRQGEAVCCGVPKVKPLVLRSCL